MPNTVLIGSQWGDEGKGKIIDVLARDVDMVVRFQGGNNAGHTVKINDNKYVLHLIPSGIFHTDQQCVIGNGVVVDPLALIAEIDEVEAKGLDIHDRLFISDRAHLVMPYHGSLDASREARLSDDKKIGTTKRGIGPAYGDKVSRVGLRAGDMLDDSFGELLGERIDDMNRVLEAMDGVLIERDATVNAYLAAVERIKPYIVDTVVMINEAVAAGKNVLFEGAQGTMLDIDFGTYPFVTSSNTTAGGACTGSGVAPGRIDRVVGVVKAYTTRVGEGPFPTELLDATGEQMRAAGGEFGATTGRPRRCGWFDAVVVRHSAIINGVDYWAMTKLDVLDGLETLKICTAYECAGKTYTTIPARADILRQCKPVYEEMPGWMESTSEVKEFDQLPEKAKAYVNRLCELIGGKLGILSVGPKRASTIRLEL